MGLSNDYFLLYHGITFEQNLDVENIDTKLDEDSFSIFSLILSATRKECDKYLPLTSFKTICQKINVKTPSNITQLNHLQHNIVEIISNNLSKKNIAILHQSFEYLKEENIINNENYSKLISLFDPSNLDIKEKSPQKIENQNKSTFKELKTSLETIILELKDLLKNEELKKELKETSNYLDNQKFSIGITGVMNAGKSTMLNALMGKEILGSAVVPETANLTVVKHNIQENAKVYFWNTNEWQKIENSAKELESMKEFVEETNLIFKDNLKDFIKDVSRCDEIEVEELSSYTSAAASGKKCNLVKYVELGSNLKFLSDGIEIVDTPGLDDPVIQREEITKEYLAKCDMMLHLMNVSQSATLKDVEFIIDALLYQNVTKLLVVITRADTVSKQQLQEVINYTKSSIKKQLKLQNKDSQLDYILNTIKFIPISGKMALLHRTGKEQEALNSGFTLEDTGILEIENYLEQTLFGQDSQKGELVVQSVKNQLKKVIDKQDSFYNYELKILSKSKDELEDELKEFQEKKERNSRILSSLSEDISYYKNDAKEYINSLETFLNSELIDLQNIIKQRVISDVRYSFEKTKKTPQSSRIKVIIQTAIKDGIIDVIRDYRYKFIKKAQTIGEQCEQKYQDLGFSLGGKNNNFDARAFFQEDFKAGFLTSNNEVLITQITNAVSKAKESKLNELDRQIEVFIKNEFNSIEENIKQKAKTISSILIENFFKLLNNPLKSYEEQLKNDEMLIQSQLNSSLEDENSKNETSIKIHKNIKSLQSILTKVKGLY